MNHIDFDPKVANCDAYGNVTAKAQTYKGFTIDDGVTIKVWHADEFIGKYATVKLAKDAIDAIVDGVDIVD